MSATAMRPAPAQQQVVEQDEEDQLADSAVQINALENVGVQAGDVKKLKAAGFFTVDKLAMTSKRKIGQIRGISDTKAEKIYDESQKICRQKLNFKSASDLVAERQRNVKKITSGAKELDAVLGGGIETSAITMFYGENRTGKSQLALTLCVASFLPEQMGGAEGKALFIDTEGSFRPERIEPIATRFGLEPQFILDNIECCRAYNPDNVEEALKAAAEMLSQEPFRVVVIDSLMAPLRVEYSGRGELAERQQRLNGQLNELKLIADEHGIAVYISNQVTADPGASAFMASQAKPIGGNIMLHACDVIVQLKKGKGDQRIAKVVQSPLMPEGDASFVISPGGVQDCSD